VLSAPRFRRLGVAAAGALTASALSACATSPPTVAAWSAGRGTVYAAASTNAWGSILEQLGGSHVRAVSLITSPDTDPHDYEPTPADGRVIASARLFVENGVGYDSWAAKAVAANPDPHRVVLDVGALVGVAEGGNPHRWYSPGDVEKVADQITSDLKRLDPADAAYFAGRRTAFETTALAGYHRVISRIRSRYAGVKVGASESIFSPMAQALGLDLVTPPSFLSAISEGTDPSAADKATVDAQIRTKTIRVYVFNSQNATPDVAAQVDSALAAGIPVSTVTETLSPKGSSFQDWQTSQLTRLERALAKATGG